MVNFADVGREVKAFHPDAPLSPSRLFGTFAEAVDEKFREEKSWSAALLDRPKPSSKTFERASPSQSEDHRQHQKSSMATCVPPISRSRGRRAKRGNA